jgi:hypothetical protein
MKKIAGLFAVALLMLTSCLGGEMIYEDHFDRSDEYPLASPWLGDKEPGNQPQYDLIIEKFNLKYLGARVGSSHTGIARYDGTFSKQQFSEIRWEGLSSWHTGPMARMITSGDIISRFMGVELAHGSGSSVMIRPYQYRYNRVLEVPLQITTYGEYKTDLDIGDIIRLSTDLENNWKVSINGAVVMSWTASLYFGSQVGAPGFVCYSLDSGGGIEDFTGVNWWRGGDDFKSGLPIFIPGQ